MSVHTSYPYTKYKDESGAVVYEFITTNPENKTLIGSCLDNGTFYKIIIKNIRTRTRFYAKFDLDSSDYTSENISPLSCPKYSKVTCIYDGNKKGLWIYSNPDTPSSGLLVAVVTTYGDVQPPISVFFNKVVTEYLCDIYNGLTGEIIKKDYVYSNSTKDLSDCNVLVYDFRGELNYPTISTTLHINGIELKVENLEYHTEIKSGDFK